MDLVLTQNPLHNQEQTLTIDKVATLIGENGSGKSTILQSVFEQKLSQEDHESLQVIGFSSGQNENYSKSFSNYLKRERRNDAELNLDVFYFDKNWSKLLIFLATTQKKEGKVRAFLRNANYVLESADSTKLDESTELSCKFKVDKKFVTRVKAALKKEEIGETETIRATPYFRSLDSFIDACVQDGYSFDDPIRKTEITLNAEKLFDVSFLATRPNEEEEENTQTVADPVVSFFVQAADNDYFIDRSTLSLTFTNNLEMDKLSDGEYQLLFLYALIDLFDSDRTLFLLDEADSHLHYQNIEKLWSILHAIKGYAVTTTHLLDSITANTFSALKVVEKGEIKNTNKIKQLINRLSVLSRAKSVEFEVCAKIPHIALLDDYNDWIIFKKLADRKGLNTERLNSIHSLKKGSSFGSLNETFAKSKLDWTIGLSQVECDINTTKIFLICDKDEAPIDFNENDGVQVAGREYRDKIRTIDWPRDCSINVYLLAWKRREIKHYLLSYTALTSHGKLDEINDVNLAAVSHLQESDPGDNDHIGQLPSDKIKDVLSSLIETEGVGFDEEKLQNYINLIPPDEISEDITNMYNFITAKL